MLGVAIAALLTALSSCSLIPAIGIQQISPHTAPQSPTLTTNQPPGPAYLVGEIPPCTPATGSAVDPCESGRESLGEYGGSLDLPEEPHSVQYFLEGGLDHVPHIVLRSTYLPGTVRCATTVFRPRPYLGPDAYRFLGGKLILKCYTDVRVNAYLLGSGPPTLTVKVAHDFYPETWGEAQIEEFKTAWEKTLTDGSDVFGGFDNIEAFPGRETILFVGPAVGIAVEVWEVFDTWNIERRDDDTVIAVHPYRRYYSLEEHQDKLEMDLPSFTQAVVAAQAARVAANGGRVLPEPGHPMLITDVHHLSRFFTEVGAYEDGLVPERPPVVPPWRFATNVDTDPDTRPFEQPPPK